MKVWHLAYLKSQGAFGDVEMSTEKMAEIEREGRTYTALAEDGEVLAVAGLLCFWKGRYEAWAFLNQNRPKEFFAIHRITQRYLDTVKGRVEAVVDKTFENGHRWARALGFKVEAETMEKYCPNGNAATLYSRVT